MIDENVKKRKIVSPYPRHVYETIHFKNVFIFIIRYSIVINSYYKHVAESNCCTRCGENLNKIYGGSHAK